MTILKQILVIVSFIFSVSPIWSQVKSGPIISISNSWIDKIEIEHDSYGAQYGQKDGNWKNQISFQLGYQFMFPLKSKFAVSSAILYQSRGIHIAYDRTSETKLDESKRINALVVNGILNYYIVGKIPLGIGLEPTYYINTKMEENLQKKSVLDVPLVFKAGYNFGYIEVALTYKHGFKSLYWNSLYRKTATRDIQFSIFVPLFH